MESGQDRDSDVTARGARADDKLPHTRKVGRYLFFAVCAFGVSVLAWGLCREIGFAKEICRVVADVTALACFLALRDMLKGQE
jgi:hypothetical protein